MSDKLIKCKSCGKEIDKNAKTCPGCGAKNKKPIYKKVWFWIIILIIIIAIGAGGTSENNNTTTNNSTKYSKNKGVTVTVVDMSAMTEADIDKWAEDNKLNIERKNEY